MSKALTVSDALMAFTLQTCFYFFNLTFKNNIVKYKPVKLDKELVVRTPELLCGPQGDTKPSKAAWKCCALVLGGFRHLVSPQTLCPHVAPRAL